MAQMFNWFKKNKGRNAGPRNWEINAGADLRMIKNSGSIQYVNEDGSRVIYVSLLRVSGEGPISNGVFPEEPKILETANGWELKGFKSAAGQVLVCVISFTRADDAAWARTFFYAIKYRDL